MKEKLPTAIVLVGIVCCFFTCNKTVLTTPTALRVINVYPSSAPQDMYLDGKLLQPNSITYGNNTATYSIEPGTYNFKITPTGTTNFNTDDNIDFGTGKNYLMFLVHANDTIQPEAAQIVLTTLGYDTSAIRFFDFSPNSPTLDIAFHLKSFANPRIYYVDTIYTVYARRYYNDQYDKPAYKTFYPLPSGQYNFKLRYTSTTSAIDSMNLTLTPGKSYTIYSRGYIDSSGVPPLIIDTIIH